MGRSPADLREGDVFSVASEDFLPLDDFRRPQETARFLRTCRRFVSQLSDETVAQRQVSGMAYRQVLARASAPGEPPQA
jgi:hypothetical protein